MSMQSEGLGIVEVGNRSTEVRCTYGVRIVPHLEFFETVSTILTIYTKPDCYNIKLQSVESRQVL
jgi:hypothetical protein